MVHNLSSLRNYEVPVHPALARAAELRRPAEGDQAF